MNVHQNSARQAADKDVEQNVVNVCFCSAYLHIVQAPNNDRRHPSDQRKHSAHLSEARAAAKPPRPPPPAAVSKPAAQSQSSSRSLNRGISDDLAASDSVLYGSDQACDEEEIIEERSDDRANDPACIQCDDGGALLCYCQCSHCYTLAKAQPL